MIRCPKCGKVLEDSVRFCTGCGYPIHTLRNENGSNGNKTQKKPPQVRPENHADGSVSGQPKQQTGPQTRRQAGQQTGQQTGPQAQRQPGPQTGPQAQRQPGPQTGPQAQRQPGPQAGPQTRRQAKQQAKQQTKQQTQRQAKQQAGPQAPKQPEKPGKKTVKRVIAAVAIGLVVVAAGTGGVALALHTAGQGGGSNFLKEASQLLEEGNYADCVAYTQDALLKDENNPQLLTILGQALVEQGDYQNAADAFAQLDLGDLDSSALLRYAEALLHSDQMQQLTTVMERYLDQLKEPGTEDTDLLVETAVRALQQKEQVLLERCLDALGSWMDSGLTQLEWNLETAETLVDSALSSPARETLEAAASYYLKAAEKAGLTTEVQDKLADCYKLWRQTDADPWKADWSCYQALMTAASESSDEILLAYVQYLTDPDAQLDILAEKVMAQQNAGSLEEENTDGVDPQPICDAILQACAQQNGSASRMLDIQNEMSAKNYRQAMALWEEDPWLQGCGLWYWQGTVSLWPFDTTGSCLYLSPEGIYYGQVAGGKQEGTGVMLMRGSDGHLLVSEGQWTGGAATAPWTDLDGAQPAEAAAGSSSAASKAASSGSGSSSKASSKPASSSSKASSQTTQKAPAASSQAPAASSQAPSSSTAQAPVDQQTLQELMRQAEQQAQSMLDAVS